MLLWLFWKENNETKLCIFLWENKVFKRDCGSSAQGRAACVCSPEHMKMLGMDVAHRQPQPWAVVTGNSCGLPALPAWIQRQRETPAKKKRMIVPEGCDRTPEAAFVLLPLAPHTCPTPPYLHLPTCAHSYFKKQTTTQRHWEENL